MIKQTHIGAYGLIKNEGKILLTMHESGPYKGLLDLPGGNFLHGETARQCITREMEKDSDIDITDLKLSDVHTDRIEWTNNDITEDLHLICILFNIKATINKIKNQYSNWFDIKSIKYNMLTPMAKKAIEDLE